MKPKTKNLLEFGIINIDKPSGPTSFTISDFVKKALDLRKTSHFGTLDPKVTGVLPVALNRACKLTGFFLGHDKEYVGIMRIHEDIELSKIKKAIEEKFLGKIKQTPPVKSRVKRQEREREIKTFELLEKNGKDILFKTKVQGGTYIRKLCDDLGKELGIGAHMLELRRIQAGIFNEEDKVYPSVNLYDLEKAIRENKLDKIIIPAEEAIKKVFPSVEVKKDAVERILHGQPIYDKDLKKRQEAKPLASLSKSQTKETFDKDSLIAVFSGEQFIGIFKVINAIKIFAKSDFTLQPI
ncbi:MAG: RNA-guided pseudouridylation complex pseudouridine synthase subunit Cbf5 [archaeon]